MDINVDVGEGIGNEAFLMPYISSCNIACGGHAGDFETMRQVVKLAKKNNVKIGAHPSFPDKVNFGRKPMDISCAALYTSVKENIQITYEAFADRNYNNDLTLVSRDDNNAIIDDANLVFDHVYRMVSTQKVKTIQGLEIQILADTFCIHGDNPKAVDLIQNLSKRLQEKGIQIK